MFAKNVVVTNPEPGWLVIVFQILRGFADNTAGKKMIARADGGQAGQINIGPDDALRAEFDAFINHRIGRDFHSGIEPGFGMNYSRRMDHRIKVGDGFDLPS